MTLIWGTGQFEGLVAEPGKKWRAPSAAEFASRQPGEFDAPALPMTTTDSIPGMEIVELLGIVSGVATLSSESVSVRKTSEEGLLRGILSSAEARMAASAQKRGGNAVIGVIVSWASGNVGGMTIGTAAGRGDKVTACVTGTAVVAQPIPL
jgi:uncharacterized protein YbjQ (UPF0145 family)